MRIRVLAPSLGLLIAACSGGGDETAVSTGPGPQQRSRPPDIRWGLGPERTRCAIVRVAGRVATGLLGLDSAVAPAGGRDRARIATVPRRAGGRLRHDRAHLHAGHTAVLGPALDDQLQRRRAALCAAKRTAHRRLQPGRAGADPDLADFEPGYPATPGRSDVLGADHRRPPGVAHDSPRRIRHRRRLSRDDVIELPALRQSNPGCPDRAAENVPDAMQDRRRARSQRHRGRRGDVPNVLRDRSVHVPVHDPEAGRSRTEPAVPNRPNRGTRLPIPARTSFGTCPRPAMATSASISAARSVGRERTTSSATESSRWSNAPIVPAG